VHVATGGGRADGGISCIIPVSASVNAIDVKWLDENIIRVKYNIDDWTDTYDITGQVCYQGEIFCFLEFDIMKKNGHYTDSTENVGLDYTRDMYTRIVYHIDHENPTYVNTTNVDKDKIEKKDKNETKAHAISWWWGENVRQDMTKDAVRHMEEE